MNEVTNGTEQPRRRLAGFLKVCALADTQGQRCQYHNLRIDLGIIRLITEL